MTKAKPNTYLVFIDNSGFDSETELRRMTGDEIREEFTDKRGVYQYGIAIVEGNLIKGFESKTDLTKL